MTQTTFRPESGSHTPDTVVVSYYPLGGNDGNTGARYQQEANITGFDIIGITREGSDTTIKNPALRDDFSPASFDDRWQHYAGELDTPTKDYDYIIVRGQSTGSFPALNIVSKGLVKATHLLVEDGINLRQNRLGQPKGHIASRLDWAIGTATDKLMPTALPNPSWHKPEGEKTENGLQKFLAEHYHWAPLWRSKYSRQTALDIIRTRPDLAMQFIFLGRSATNTPAGVSTFLDTVEKIEALHQTTGKPLSPVVVRYFGKASHSIIEYPQFGAANLLITRSLKSLVTR